MLGQPSSVVFRLYRAFLADEFICFTVSVPAASARGHCWQSSQVIAARQQLYARLCTEASYMCRYPRFSDRLGLPKRKSLTAVCVVMWIPLFNHEVRGRPTRSGHNGPEIQPSEDAVLAKWRTLQGLILL